MAKVFHRWPYGRFKEIKSNFRRKKLYRVNQGSNILGGSFTKRDNVIGPVKFGRERQPQHLKRWISSKENPSISISIAPLLLDQSKETSSIFPAMKLTSHFMPQYTVSRSFLEKRYFLYSISCKSRHFSNLSHCTKSHLFVWCKYVKIYEKTIFLGIFWHFRNPKMSHFRIFSE